MPYRSPHNDREFGLKQGDILVNQETGEQMRIDSIEGVYHMYGDTNFPTEVTIRVQLGRTKIENVKNSSS